MMICSSIFAQATAQKPVNLIVTDEKKNVSDLKQEEIALFIDGKAQTDFSVEMQTLPLLYVLAVDNSGSLRVVFGDIIDIIGNKLVREKLFTIRY